MFRYKTILIAFLLQSSLGCSGASQKSDVESEHPSPVTKRPNPSKTNADSRTKSISPLEDESIRDNQVIEIALGDCLTSEEFILRRKVPRDQAQIIMDTRTPPYSGVLNSEQLHSDVNRDPKKVIPIDVENNLRVRNQESVEWPAFNPSNKQIIILNLEEYECREWPMPNGAKPQLIDKFPNAVGWARVWRPGYSKDGKTTLLRFAISPSPHGAAMIYLLQRENGVWTIKWRKFVMYA